MPDIDTEPDSEGEHGTTETNQEQDQVKRRIYISSGDQVVDIQGPDSLDEISQLVAYFWLLTSPPETLRTGFSAGTGLTTEISHEQEIG